MSSPSAPTVLLVEDNEDTRVLYAEYLRLEGFNVVTAADGIAGLTAARRHHPDVVLMDVTMPGLDGFAATAALKREPALAHIPVLMLTAHVFPADRRRAEDAGSAGFICKPCLPEELLTAIRVVLAPS